MLNTKRNYTTLRRDERVHDCETQADEDQTDVERVHDSEEQVADRPILHVDSSASKLPSHPISEATKNTKITWISKKLCTSTIRLTQPTEIAGLVSPRGSLESEF